MTRFTGQSEHKLDAKGRLFLPRRVVDAVKDPQERSHFFLTIGVDPCIYLFTPSGFDRHLAQVEDRVRGQDTYPDVMRGIAALTFDQDVDGQGRILLPEKLRSHTGVAKEVAVVGVFGHVQIWDAARWRETEALKAEQAYLEQSKLFFLGGVQQRGVES